MVNLKKTFLIGGILGVITFFIPAYFASIQDADISGGFTVDMTLILTFCGVSFAEYVYSPFHISEFPKPGMGFYFVPFLMLVGFICLVFAIFLLVARVKNKESSQILVIFGATMIILNSSEMLFEFLVGFDPGIGISLTLVPIAPIIYVVLGIFLLIQGFLEK